MKAVKRLVRAVLRRAPKPLSDCLERIAYYGNRFYCPVCGRSARTNRSYGVDMWRPHARCPFCDSLERHRLVWRFLELKTNFFQSAGKQMLHIAAEKCFEPKFRKLIGKGYVTADLMEPADVKMDITDIQYPDQTFDIVYCSHVLEHVPDDRKAMREFFRVLKPTGWAILMVPISAERTVEDPSITDPQERLRLFGQDDHVRRYGPDFADRLKEAGFTAQAIGPEDILSAEEIERIAVRHDYTGDIYYCMKAATSA